MKIQWNKVTWYSKLAAVVLGIAILLLGMYVGTMYQRGLDAIELAEQLNSKRPPFVKKETKIVYEFAEEGNIKNMAPEGEEVDDDWTLIYEKAGAPALTQRVVFTTESRCAFTSKETFCDTSKLEQGQRVKVMGHADVVGLMIVELLEVVR